MRLKYGCRASEIAHVQLGQLNEPLDFGNMLDNRGSVVALQRTMWRLGRQDPAALKVIDEEVRANGFAGADEFAEVGDRVLMAGAVAKGEELGLMLFVDAALAMSDEELAALPRRKRILLSRVRAFGERRYDVPVEDQALIHDFWDELEKIDAN